ncbi:MAG: hypothetical protein HY804_05810 [Nitrospinae bacterium]|nr:hypothetical protein [Nitrospinota bacterium]
MEKMLVISNWPVPVGVALKKQAALKGVTLRKLVIDTLAASVGMKYREKSKRLGRPPLKKKQSIKRGKK